MSEGIFDVVGWHKSGFKNAVCCFGKVISRQQLHILREINPKTLFVALDGDATKQSYNFVEQFGQYFADVKIISMPNRDADELTQSELLNVFSRAKHYSWADKMRLSM